MFYSVAEGRDFYSVYFLEEEISNRSLPRNGSPVIQNYGCHMTSCLILPQIFILLGILEFCSLIIFFLKLFGLKKQDFLEKVVWSL